MKNIKTHTSFKALGCTVTVAFLLLIAPSCKRDYIVGGKPQDVNMYKDMTTYDVLKSLPQFDTLVQVIDAANFKEKINQSGATFFAITNGSIYDYLNSRTLYLQATVDQNKMFLLDSLVYYLKNNIRGTADSLGMYLIPNATLTPDNTNAIGKLYPTALNGNNVIVSFEPTKEEDLGYFYGTSTVPKILYFTQLWRPYDLGPDNTAADVPAETGVHIRISTCFINTKNGVLNILSPNSSLFFYGTKYQ